MRASSIIAYDDPAAVLAAAETEIESTPSEKLFNASKYQKLLERWCAGMFGVGYSKFVAPCQVAVNEDRRYRQDVDMFLRAGGRDWEFQLAEAQEPGRQRGLEFRRFADGTVRTIAYDPERGRLEGPQWLGEAVALKKAKLYESSQALHLLVYGNFPAQQLDYVDVVDALSPFREDFASIWIVTSLHVASVFSPPDLAEVKGWGVVRSIEDYYA
jgi:hypothetical protein